MIFNGGLKNQTKTIAVTAKRIAISKMAGKSASANFAKTNPLPQITGTLMARKMSVGFKIGPPNGVQAEETNFAAWTHDVNSAHERWLIVN